MHLNDALRSAKQDAEEANVSKTRFLAAAGSRHHAADEPRPASIPPLWSIALRQLQKRARTTGIAESSVMATNIDSSLEAVEDILAALLDIARLDSGAMKPQISAFPIDELPGPDAHRLRASGQGKGP